MMSIKSGTGNMIESSKTLIQSAIGVFTQEARDVACEYVLHQDRTIVTFNDILIGFKYQILNQEFGSGATIEKMITKIIHDKDLSEHERDNPFINNAINNYYQSIVPIVAIVEGSLLANNNNNNITPFDNINT